MSELNEQELFRRKSLEDLRNLGIDPYPAPLFSISTTTSEIKAGFPHSPEKFTDISLAGRLMTRRIMGNASFAEIQDSTGRIQIYLKRDEICPEEDKSLYNTVFKKLLDLGDIIGITGYAFITQTGELSIHVRSLTILAKSLKPLPVVKTDGEGNVFDAVSDPEFRYRQRYADLIINPHVREVFIRRTRMIDSMRATLNAAGYLEVETPVLQPIPGGATARPFITHHNTLDMPLYLRIANELYLKRLIVGGFDGVYEFAKDFRNEGMDRSHNPEFSMMELYVAYKDYTWMMGFTETILSNAVMDLHGITQIEYNSHTIDFKGPYPRVAIYDAIMDKTGLALEGMSEEELRTACSKLDLPVSQEMGKGKLVDEIFGAFCEPTYIQPTFITDYPVEMSPLTKKHRSKPGLVERFELIVNGKEIANAYSELNDPLDQRARFEDQLALSARGDQEAMFIDKDFLRALEYGMPPTAGIGIGIDRLAMLLTGQHSIQDVLLFPQMRAETGN